MDMWGVGRGNNADIRFSDASIVVFRRDPVGAGSGDAAHKEHGFVQGHIASKVNGNSGNVLRPVRTRVRDVALAPSVTGPGVVSFRSCRAWRSRWTSSSVS